MELRFVPPELGALDGVPTEVLVCGLFADERPPRGVLGLVDWRLAGRVSRLCRDGFLTGALGEVAMLTPRPKVPFDKVIVLGLGPRAELDAARYRGIVRTLLGTMAGLASRTAVVELPGRHAGALPAETAADVLLEEAAGGAKHDVWTLVERPDDQKRIVAHRTEQRRRVRTLTDPP